MVIKLALDINHFSLATDINCIYLRRILTNIVLIDTKLKQIYLIDTTALSNKRAKYLRVPISRLMHYYWILFSARRLKCQYIQYMQTK
jgi:hypothetical protein